MPRDNTRATMTPITNIILRRIKGSGTKKSPATAMAVSQTVIRLVLCGSGRVPSTEILGKKHNVIRDVTIDPARIPQNK